MFCGERFLLLFCARKRIRCVHVTGMGFGCDGSFHVSDKNITKNE